MTNKEQSNLLMSRLSLMRNIDEMVFTAAMTTEQSESVIRQVQEVIQLHSVSGKFKWVNRPLDERFTQRQLLGLGTLLTDPVKGHLKLQYYDLPDEFGYLMVNDLDHLRLGLQGQRSFESLWNRLDHLDDEFAKHLNFAYDDNLGYLSSKLEWLGTGLKGEAILHLPALKRTGYIQALSETAGSIGLTIKPLMGGFYKLNNTVTLGRSELELAILMDQTVQMLIDRESAGRETLFSSKKDSLIDELGRSFGLASYATQMEVDEAMAWFSDILFAGQLGLIEGLTTKLKEAYAVFCHISDDGIDAHMNRNLRQSERSRYRAALIYQWTQGLRFRR